MSDALDPAGTIAPHEQQAEAPRNYARPMEVVTRFAHRAELSTRQV